MAFVDDVERCRAMDLSVRLAPEGQRRSLMAALVHERCHSVGEITAGGDAAQAARGLAIRLRDSARPLRRTSLRASAHARDAAKTRQPSHAGSYIRLT
jgi:hypothetical protein